MAYWLFKSEPKKWSWDDQVKEGEKGAEWDGVRNYQAANNMKAMKIGDHGFFYHSVTEKRIVGIVEVVTEYYPDPTDAKKIFGMVDVKAVETLKKPVLLSDIKSNERLLDFGLVRQSRLSVVPVSTKHWDIIMTMGGMGI